MEIYSDTPREALSSFKEFLDLEGVTNAKLLNDGVAYVHIRGSSYLPMPNLNSILGTALKNAHVIDSNISVESSIATLHFQEMIP